MMFIIEYDLTYIGILLFLMLIWNINLLNVLISYWKELLVLWIVELIINISEKFNCSLLNIVKKKEIWGSVWLGNGSFILIVI